MRVVVLTSSLYSETACAVAARLAQSGHTPVGALSVRTLHPTTLLRKLAQWGWRDFSNYARTKLLSGRGERPPQLRNIHLRPFLEHGHGIFRSLREVAALYGFPISLCNNQNAPDSIACLNRWSPDLLVFAGGNILRKPLLAVPRFGTLNAHLGLLPEIRGMSTPEWSLLRSVPLGVTIHNVDAGIDTGPILQRCELPDAAASHSLVDLRHRLIAFGVTKTVDVVSALDRGEISATPQSDQEQNNDTQFFVMHELLQKRAAALLTKDHSAAENVQHG